MTYLTRGPGSMPGIGSKGRASREPTPFRLLTVKATGGEGMSGPQTFANVVFVAFCPATTPQATP